MFGKAAAAALLLATGAAVQTPGTATAEQQAQWVAACKDWDDWDKAGPPFPVYGNVYYVGTCGISAVLIVGDHGNILIDGGPADAGDLVAANIEKLGFKLSKVKILLHTHEHHDHVGGLARLKELTGARLYASRDAARALESGAPIPEDPQAESLGRFPAVQVDEVLSGDASVRLGSLTLKAIATPGHTPGALSWQWRSCEGDVCKTIVYADSLTPVSSDGYRFSDHPEAVAAFRASLAKVAALDCDILLSPHPSASGMRDKLRAGDLAAPPSCKDYAAGLSKRLDERLASEADGG